MPARQNEKEDGLPRETAHFGRDDIRAQSHLSIDRVSAGTVVATLGSLASVLTEHDYKLAWWHSDTNQER